MTTLAPKPQPPEMKNLEGSFGSLAVIPLINELFPENLINAIVLGFQRHPQGLAGGLLQNDGQIFPSPEDLRVELVFCKLCQSRQYSNEFKRRCKLSDSAGVKLLLGKDITSDEQEMVHEISRPRENVVTYFCHAGLMEMITPVYLKLGKGKNTPWKRNIGVFWAGQKPQRAPQEMKIGLGYLASLLGVPHDKLNDQYFDWWGKYKKILEQYREYLQKCGKPVKGVSDDDLHTDLLIDTAKSISDALTELYHQKEKEKTRTTIARFSRKLGESVRRIPMDSNRESGIDRLRNYLREELEDFVIQYRLSGSAIFEISQDLKEQKKYHVHSFASWPKASEHAFSIQHSTELENTIFNKKNKPSVLIGEQVQNTHLLARLTRTIGCSDTHSAVGYIFFGSEYAGEFIWIAAEEGDKQWHISQHGLQQEFEFMLSDLADRIETCISITKLLNELTEQRDEKTILSQQLKKQQDLAHVLVLRMAHQVSRPILELNLAASLLSAEPHSQNYRDHFKSCLLELRLAAANFKAFESLMGDETIVREHKESSFSLHKLIDDTRKRLSPLARLKRRSIEVYSQRGYQNPILYANQNVAGEILENLLHNAIKYSVGGKPVEIRLASTEKYVSIRFVNYGCCIDESEKEKIFERDFRAKSAKTIEMEGAGIGLWVARELAKREGSTLDLEGCEFGKLVDHPKAPGENFNQYKVVFRLTIPITKHP